MMKPSANLVSFRWTLLLSACLALTVSADCGTDCAYCSMHQRLHQTDINSIACVLQCKGQLNIGSSWGLCQGILQTSAGPPEAERVSRESTPNPQHQEEKRYGGFMKRYGGFMKRYGGFMKKTAELYGLEPTSETVDRSREILSKSDMEMLANQIEDDGEREEAALRNVVNGKGSSLGLEGVAKRYGGFMRRGYAPEGGYRPLEKRYGGFMRRVGRPEWREESKRYGGFLQRSPQEEEEEESSEMKKRYGGFMGY